MSETPQILLAHHLKRLKLPTFLREHEKIARLCAAEGKDHMEQRARAREIADGMDAMRDQGHVYLYPYKDESGRWAFVNYGYFLPWAMHERTARNTMQVATGDYGGSVNDFMSEVGVPA